MSRIEEADKERRRLEKGEPQSTALHLLRAERQLQQPKNIWLINLGDEITWCDDPEPSSDIDEDDVTGYVRADIHGKLETQLQQANKDKAALLWLGIKINSTLIAHGKFDANTPLHEQLDDALFRCLPIAAKHKEDV